MNKKLLSVIATIIGLSSTAPAFSQSFILQPSALFFGTCKISATNISFGTVTPSASGTKTATGNISSLCTIGTFYDIKVNRGTNGTFANRQMAGTSTNTDKLNYQLYRNSGYTEVLGDGTAGTNIYSGFGWGFTNNNAIYASMPLNQYVKPDNYTDTLTVSITY